jgi:hypothetical protein
VTRNDLTSFRDELQSFLSWVLNRFFRSHPVADTFSLANKMLGEDALVADDQAKLTADQADDATAHSDLLGDLNANGPFLLIADDSQSAKFFSTADGQTIDIKTVRIATQPTA